MSGLLLQLKEVVKAFGAVRALSGVSFDLQPGEVHALLGENGAGKSTLIKIITGAHQPDAGTVQIGGRAVRHLTPALAHRLGIACIYQQPALFPDLTVAENIALRLEPARALRRVNWVARENRARELLGRLGAKISPESEVRELSMPEQQLVEIACAVGAGARVVIMDEPTASLTQKEQHLLFRVVRDLRAAGVGVVYISHRLEEIFALADRVTVLRDGQSVGTCSLDEITETELIRMMVGRDLPPRPQDAEREPGAVILSLRDIGCAASEIHGVNLEVRSGEILGIAGLVGAGRTELARVLFGLTPAEEGEIWFHGRRIEVRSPQEALRHGIAYVPEDRRRHGIVLEMAIAANMSMAIHRRIFPGTWLRPKAERQLALEYMRALSIKAYGPDAPGNSLSGGNQQKVALARWLAAEPRLLILDEPTQGVDVGAKNEIHGIIKRLAGEGLGIVLISSDLNEVLSLSDRVAVMRGGTITSVFSGKIDPHIVLAAALGQSEGVGGAE